MPSEMQPTPSPDPFDPANYYIGDSLGYLLSRAKTVMMLDAEQEVSGLDITHAQAVCLLMLTSGRARTVTDLGRELSTDMGSITRLLDRMQKRGLIERKRSDTDRRVVDIAVTDAGNALAQAVPEAFSRVLRRRFRDFSPAELDQFRAMLLRIIGNSE